MNRFNVIPSDHHIWNQYEFEKFLIENCGKDIELIVNEGCDCEQIGLFKTLDLFEFNSVTINCFNIIQHSVRYTIVHSPGGCFNFFTSIGGQQHQYQPYHSWNRKKVFSAFYNRPIWHRIGLASHLLTYYPNKTLLNFRYDPTNIDLREEFEINRLFVNHPESLRLFGNCYNQFPVRVEAQDGYTVGATTQAHTDQLCDFYPNILIDIVAETFVTGNLFFSTEKTVRPILLKKPMVVMGGKNHLLYLRQMGFRTFNEFWDESYDGYEGPERYIKILELIDKLSIESIETLETMYSNMQYTLDYNYNLLINQSYSKKIQRID